MTMFTYHAPKIRGQALKVRGQEGTKTQRRKFCAFVSLWLRPSLPWLGVSIFLGLFFFYPLARILWLGLNPASLLTITPDSFLVTSHSLLFTFYQAFLSTLLTLLVIPVLYTVFDGVAAKLTAGIRRLAGRLVR